MMPLQEALDTFKHLLLAELRDKAEPSKVDSSNGNTIRGEYPGSEQQSPVTAEGNRKITEGDSLLHGLVGSILSRIDNKVLDVLRFEIVDEDGRGLFCTIAPVFQYDTN